MATYDLAFLTSHGEGDCGAVGNNFQEVERAKVLTGKILTHLRSKGLSVLSNYEDGKNNYNRNLTKGHTFNYKMAFTLHLNSGTSSAVGSEILVPFGESYFVIENEILNGLKGLGFTNRGIKSRDYNSENWVTREHGKKVVGKDWYREVREAWENGVSLSIIEACFISNVNDIKRFNGNIDKIAVIIADAILKACGKMLVSDTNGSVGSGAVGDSGKCFRVITGSFRDRANAEERIKLLKEKGFESFIEIK